MAARANVEIKARLADPEAAERRAVSLGARFAGEDRQRDTYYRVPRGRLKLRESSIDGGRLVVYLRPDAASPRRSDYELLPVENVERSRALLQEMLGAEAEVRKIRRIYLLGGTRIHLDAVEGLGSFLEFEAVHAAGDAEAEAAARREVERLLRAFEVRDEDLLAGSYREMIQAGPDRR